MRTLAFLALAAALLAAGCATEQPAALDANFGRAVNAAKSAQTLEPAAGTRQRAPAGTDGRAARSSVEQYEKSYAQPPAPGAVFNIGIGGGTAGGSSR